MKYLKEIRKEAGLDQRQMAELLNISYGYYKQIENDFRQPSYVLLLKIKQEFRDLDMNKLFEDAS
ncbi:helix-turn-helix domain-containing protein [Enterococcus raffinosus]